MSGNERAKTLVTGFKKQISKLSSSISKIAKAYGDRKEKSPPALEKNEAGTGADFAKALEEAESKRLAQAKSPGYVPCSNTIISKETEINGSITSCGNVSVNGLVKGNVTSQASVKITGTVEGDVTARSVELLSGKIYGNIKSQKSVVISSESSIKGDIECDMLDLNGKVNGNSIVYTTATLGEEAVIHGNLTSQNLSIKEGAVVDGNIKVSKESITVNKKPDSPSTGEFDICLNPLSVGAAK